MLRQQPIGDVVLADIPHAGHRLLADGAGGTFLDIVEPDIGIEAGLLRSAAEAGEVAGAGVVGGEGHERSVGLVDGRIVEICIGPQAEVFDAGLRS
jgi:hypothetical protein